MNTQLPDNGEVSGAIYKPVICPGVRGATPGSIPRWRLYRTSTHRRLSGHRFGRYSSRSQSFAFFSIAVTLPYPSVFVNPKFCSFFRYFWLVDLPQRGEYNHRNGARQPEEGPASDSIPRPAASPLPSKSPNLAFHRQKVALGNQPPTSASKLYSVPPGRDSVPPGAPVVVSAVGRAGARGR